jgi:hypothetical protein
MAHPKEINWQTVEGKSPRIDGIVGCSVLFTVRHDGDPDELHPWLCSTTLPMSFKRIRYATPEEAQDACAVLLAFFWSSITVLTQ